MTRQERKRRDEIDCRGSFESRPFCLHAVSALVRVDGVQTGPRNGIEQHGSAASSALCASIAGSCSGSPGRRPACARIGAGWLRRSCRGDAAWTTNGRAALSLANSAREQARSLLRPSLPARSSRSRAAAGCAGRAWRTAMGLRRRTADPAASNRGIALRPNEYRTTPLRACKHLSPAALISQPPCV
jgi:hypothetical protein